MEADLEADLRTKTDQIGPPSQEIGSKKNHVVICNSYVEVQYNVKMK